MQFFGFAIKLSPLPRKTRFRSGDHPKKILRLFCFFHTTTNDVAKVFFGNALICFAVISSDARAATN